MDYRRRRIVAGAVLGGLRLPDDYLLVYNKNVFDPTTLKFTDRIGANERTLYPLQYINIGVGDTGYFLNNAMVTAGTTISSTTKNGTTTLSYPSAGRLNAAAGTLWDFTVTWSDGVVSQYPYCTLVTSTYAICFDRSGNGRHLVATGFSTLSSVCVSGRSFGSDVLNTAGWSAGWISAELVTNGGNEGGSLLSTTPTTTASNVTFTLSADYAQSGSASGKITATTNTTVTHKIVVRGVSGVPAEVGVNVTGHVYIPSSLNTTGFKVYDNDDGSVITLITNVRDSWVPFTFTRSGKSVAWSLALGNNDLADWNFGSMYIDNLSVKFTYPSTVPIPARTDNPSLDALGNALTYPGRAKYSIVPKGRTGNCATFNGTSDYITGPSVTLTGNLTFSLRFSIDDLVDRGGGLAGTLFSQYVSSGSRGYSLKIVATTGNLQ